MEPDSAPRLDDGRKQFFEEVFPAELNELAKRRQALGLNASKLDAGEPRADRGLIGLALSGGGIRSATLALGAVQALARHGALRKIDYLSTVSGGGYTGSMLSSILNDPEAGVDGDAFPLHYETGEIEPAALRHLRSGSNYLAGGGFLNELRLPMIVLRGLMLNALLLLPYIALAALLTCIAFPYLFESGIVSVVVWLLMAFFLAVIWSFPMIAWLFGKNRSWDQRNRVENLQAIALLLCISAIGLSLTAGLVRAAMSASWGDVRGSILHDLSVPAGEGDQWTWLVVGLVGYLLIRIANPAAKLGSGLSKVALYLIGLSGPASMIGAYLFLLLVFGRSPFVEARFDSALTTAATASPPVIGDLELRRELAARGIGSADSAALAPRGSVYVVSESARVGEHQRWMLVDSAQVVTSAKGADTTRETRVRRFPAVLEEGHNFIHLHGNEFGAPGFRGDWLLAAFGLIVFLLNAIWVDVNVTSPHSFWRDRLSRVFLFRTGKAGDPEPNDSQKLSGLGSENRGVPYHLVNTSLNLTGSRLEDLPGRGSDFFMFSRNFVGSYATGYCTTNAMEDADPHVNLGTAVAISAAATAPNSGTVTVKPLVFMMTLLNIRLDYWAPNPAQVRSASDARRAWTRVIGPGTRYLFYEALGMLHARGPFVNLSDGGHIENLAIFELLRRRCKVIVCNDGEQDGAMSFASLAKLIRYARTDLGIEITINLKPFDPRPESGLPATHWAVGTIDYGNGEVGYLLYVKSAVTGDEARYVLDYRSRNPTFPHESTADQFFDEAQFESYRALGYHAMDGALKEVVSQSMDSRARSGRDILDQVGLGLGLLAYSPVGAAGAVVPADRRS